MGEPLTPIIVGVGDIKDPFTGPHGAEEPKYLILQAIHAAARDTGLPPYASEHLLSETDSFDVVRTWTWPYDDLATDLAQELRATPKYKATTGRHGGDQPAKLVDDAARRISTRQSRVAIVTGGEALASLGAHLTTKGSPPPHWPKTSEGSDSIFAQERELYHAGLGGNHGISSPTQIYSLYENAFRAHRKQTISENNIESTRMYGEFAKIASQNEYAWSYGRPVESEETIGMVSKRNRMICSPYPLLMTAFNKVNLAAACILTSTDHAREVGIPQSQWIYVRGGAGTKDSGEFWRRPNFYSSPSISQSLDAALGVAGVSASDVDAYDFYSCFPIVPKLACAHLGLPILPPYRKPISLLGGLTSFGGAGNNYSAHAITHMVRFLREGKGTNGLILANGGLVTYQHAICLSTKSSPAKHPYAGPSTLPESLDSLDESAIERKPSGKAMVETYTVDYARDGKPTLGHVVGRLRNGRRFLANHGNEKTLIELSGATREPIGRLGHVEVGKGGKNSFIFECEASL